MIDSTDVDAVDSLIRAASFGTVAFGFAVLGLTIIGLSLLAAYLFVLWERKTAKDEATRNTTKKA